MLIAPIHKDLVQYLKSHSLEKKFQKQALLISRYFRHPSLHTEILEPKDLKIYSFRVDKKYRAIFIFIAPEIIEVIDINNHYN